MTAIKIIRLLHCVCFLIVTSQLLYYVFVMGDAMKAININSFIEQRKIVDPMVHQRHIPFYYATLLLGVVLLAMQYRQWNSLLSITTAVATLLVITDIVIALKFNVPINQYINQYKAGDDSSTLETLRNRWITFIELRGIISMTGMVLLFAGMIFGRK
jgi:hypothetical protein